MNTNRTVFTVGHSTYPIEQFLALLKSHQVEAIADVRSSPYSKFNPQFNRENLKETLKASGIAYVFLGKELGARRAEPECYQDKRVIYDLVAKTPTFENGITRIVNGASKMRIALMCAEKDPLMCHRTILVARNLRPRVGDIHHIIDERKIETYAAAETRLLENYNLHSDDMFASTEELINQAYKKRGEEIAYVEASDNFTG